LIRKHLQLYKEDGCKDKKGGLILFYLMSYNLESEMKINGGYNKFIVTG